MLIRKFTRAFTTSSAVLKAAKLPTSPSPSLLSLKIGQIQQCISHPDADKLYVSQISHGLEKPSLTVCSGLKDFIPIEEMQGKRVVLLTNLKPVSMRGVTSEAMLLAAEKKTIDDDDGVVVELVVPPLDAPIGSELIWEGIDPEISRADDGEKLRLSPKAWKKIQGRLFTNSNGSVIYKDDEGNEHKLVVSDTLETCTVPTAFNSVVR